jgi:tRNA-dihydrouridine synthase A
MNQNPQNESMKNNVWPVSVAPMMRWTDRHYRYFMRQITRCTLLYTEMITSGAVLHGNRERLLGFSVEEKPLALQVGGDDLKELATCANIAADCGYDEINLNVGCPSERVQNGNFGACLMAEPKLVRDCLKAMKDAVDIPVTVKHRIGIDGQESYESLAKFVEVVAESGCDRFIVHSRIAVLDGLSPKDNRTVPPLRYEDVYHLKEDFPHLTIEINGGIKTLEDIAHHLQFVDGVMVGRAAYENPYLFSEVDTRFYNDGNPPKSRRQIIEAMIPYLERWIERDVYPHHIIRHMLNLFAHKPGTKQWKRYLSENGHRSGVGVDILEEAMKKVADEVLDEVDVIPHLEDSLRD